MKRVLIFSLAYYPHVGGAEVAVKEITDRISDIEFHMVTMRMDSSPYLSKEGSVLVHRVGLSNKSKLNKLLFQFLAVYKALELHRKYHYDATWALMAHSAGIPAGIFKMMHSNVKYLLNLQEGDPLKHIERTMLPLWPLFVRAFTTADIVQPLSIYLATWARHMGYRGHIEIIPNGVDIKRFSGEPIPHTGGVRLITTSRLVHKNGIDDVIRALKYLPSTTSFQILGTGPDESMLKELARKEGVLNQVEFLGHVDHSDMPGYLHGADIFVRPSRSEGQGASFVEAMGAGLPIIATQEGGIADFLFDPDKNPGKKPTGLAVSPNDPKGIAEAVEKYLSDKDLTNQIVQNAKELATKKYDWDKITKDMVERVFDPLFQKVNH